MKNELGSRLEMTRSFSPWTRLLSNLSSIVHVFLAVGLGYLLSLRPINTRVPLIFVFAVTSKLFAIMFTESRNASKKTRIYSTIALALLIPLLTPLSSFEIIMGLSILVLYSVYPLCNGKAPFDVIHHALRYVFIFILGFGSQAFSNETALLTIFAIVLFSVAGELLAGLGKSKDSTIKNAASFLGIKRSLVAIISLIFIASLIASFVLNNLFEFPIQFNGTFVPFYIIPALALDLFLTKPLMKKLNEKHVDVFHLMRRKEVIAMVFTLLLILVLFQVGRIGTTVTVNSRDYSFDVGIRTFIAGPLSWDVPWIVFNYVNEDNYYYVVFHKDGSLELSQKIDGQYQKYVSSCATQLTPFEWHNFQIVVNETTVTVSLDGEYQVTTSRQLVAETSSIIISPSTPNQVGFWIACTYHITLINETNDSARS